LSHAHSIDFDSEALGPLEAAGVVAEYGDDFSVMASPSFLPHFAAPHKVSLGWMTSGTEYQTVQSAGAYTILPYEIQTSGIKALKSSADGNNSCFGSSTASPSAMTPLLGSTRSLFPALSFIMKMPRTRAAISWISRPNTDNWLDPALPAGQTWVDHYSNLSLTVTSATASGLTVQVNLCHRLRADAFGVAGALN